VRLAQRLGITPNGVTVIGFVVVAFAAGMVAFGQLLAGAGVLVAGSLLDAVDGALARATGGTTAFGGFLDSTLDRAAEAILYAAVVVYFLRSEADPIGPVVLALAALCGSFMVSYTRAKAEAFGISAAVGLAPRTERLVLVVAGIALAGLGIRFGLIGAIGIVAALAAATTIQRIWHVQREMTELPAVSRVDSTEER
jgi:CDP-diacylglycerol--glycerol-3-phosphate 3-phosphatidyltransferase